MFDWLRNKEIRAALKDDTQEITKMTDEAIQTSGMKPWLANLLACAVGILTGAITDVSNGGNLIQLFHSPKELGMALWAAIIWRLAHQLPQPVK
jgi:hypothetical protein